MSVLAPINLQAWIAEHRHLLQPPVGNACVWNGNFLVMIVGGPNRRTDYHVNPGEELFFQVEGDIVLKIIEDGRPRDLPIKQGELFLLPARVPHSPRRPAGTVGLVVEQPKAFQEPQQLRWYCEGCGAIIYEESFAAQDVGKQIKEIIGRFEGNEALRTCKQCGKVFPGTSIV